MVFGYVYKTTNLQNKKIYVSQKCKSYFVHNYYGSGKLIQRAIKKFLRENPDKIIKDGFSTEVLEWCNSKEFLNEREIWWTLHLKAMIDYGNYVLKAGETKGSLYSEKTKAKMRIIQQTIKPMLGKRHSAETRSRISKSSALRKGWHHSEAAKKKISKSRKGIYYGILSPRFGISHTSESRKKISNNHANVSRENNPMWGKTHSLKARASLSKCRQDTVWVYSIEKNLQKQIKKFELVEYLSNGWQKGMKPR